MPWMETMKKHGFWYHFLDVLFNVVVIAAVVAAVRTFLVIPFQVEGSSMMDTLQDREYIIINKFTYLTHTPQRGDVVVFRPPNDESKYYVKRVIGVPGDTVRITGGYVYLKTPQDKDFRKLDEAQYLSSFALGETYTHPGRPTNASETYEVPDDHYFVLGDNRNNSTDSRSFIDPASGQQEPYVAREKIKGKVWFVALPITKIHALEAPKYESSVSQGMLKGNSSSQK